MGKKWSARRSLGRGANRAGWIRLGAYSDPKIIDFELARQARALEDTFASWSRRRGSYQEALSRQQAIRRNARAGPVRLVIGFLRIVLVVENWPNRGWRELDYFPLVSESDEDLLGVVAELETEGYPIKDPIKAKLAPAVFSPCGVDDPEAIDAMARLGRWGLAISSQITAIADPEFLWLADGDNPRIGGSV